MATGFEANTDVELDELESSFEAVSTDVARAGMLRRAVPELTDDADLSMDGFGWAGPQPSVLSAMTRRSVRTTAPFLIADVLSLSICAAFGQLVVSLVAPEAEKSIAIAAPAALLLLLFAYWMTDLYTEIWVHPVIEFRQLTILNSIGFLAAAAGGLLAPPFPVWCISTWVLALCLVPLFRVVARRCCGGRKWWGYRTLVIGSGAAGDALARAVLKSQYSGLRPALLTDPECSCLTSIVPVVNDPRMLESIIRAEGIRHAVVSLPELSSSRLTEVLGRFGGSIPHVLVLSDAATLPALWGASRSGGRLSGLEVRNGLLLATLQTVKRFIDLTIATITLVLGLPLLLLIAVMIKCTSHGPVFYAHTRIGRHGRRFKVWKFRTMHPNSEAVLRRHLAENAEARDEWDRDHKLRSDPRVTSVGRFLRMTSFDELPQIWNVLRGDMSLVGPRPIVQEEIARYGAIYRLYTTVKPGITGLWQVSGRNDIGYEDRVLLDQFYIRHWSPWLDVYILAKTIVALVGRSGAY